MIDILKSFQVCQESSLWVVGLHGDQPSFHTNMDALRPLISYSIDLSRDLWKSRTQSDYLGLPGYQVKKLT